MQNRIKNAQWFSQSNGKILYFTNQGPITYDKFCMNNFRFCSLSMTNGTAINAYDPMILCLHHHVLRFGYHIRAIILEHAALYAKFYDANGKLMETMYYDIHQDVDAEFHDVCATFEVPPHCATARIGLQFDGNVTACTFGMPFLELYKKN